MKRSLPAALGLALLLGGCSFLNSINPFASSPKIVPTPLGSFDARTSFNPRWSVRVGAARAYRFTPAAAGGAVFAASGDNNVVRIDDGRETWRTAADTELSGGAGSDGSYVAVGTHKGDLITFDASGKLLWKVHAGSEILAAPAVTGGLVVARTIDAKVVAFDAASGKQKWLYQRSTPALTVRSNVGLVPAGNNLLAGFPGGKLVAISVANGSALWESTVAIPRGATEIERIADVASDPVVAGSDVCAVAFQGRTACFDLAGGSSEWTRDVSSLAGLDVDGRYVYVTDEKGAVHALDRSNGSSIWRQDKLLHRSVTHPVAMGDWVVVGDGQGYLHALRREDGSLGGRYATDGSAVIGLSMAADGSLLVQTAQGTLTALALK
ncbi:MAG: outer membrane protein assembly factor BamB [Rhodocyclaceae bacterium]|nr:outer membrane protein assembly factor BamB [Rhodocyclaceae bacterium]MBX3669098.1 outer membrane protein assembly factor BamB [Rhodocyclaceae bacterium]